LAKLRAIGLDEDQLARVLGRDGTASFRSREREQLARGHERVPLVPREDRG
jgi:hypothetical protein